eukprot:UN00371
MHQRKFSKKDFKIYFAEAFEKVYLRMHYDELLNEYGIDYLQSNRRSIDSTYQIDFVYMTQLGMETYMRPWQSERDYVLCLNR